MRFQAEPLSGATASGILNPESKTQSYRTFSARLDGARTWQDVLLHLGEVDCGFVIWHKAARDRLSIDEQLMRTLDSYCEFIRQVVARDLGHVIVMSAPLPTIANYRQDWGSIAHLRSKIAASQAERTDLTREFNAELGRRSAGLGVWYADTTQQQLDPQTGLIRAEFVGTNERDHHLARRPYAAVIETALSRITQAAQPIHATSTTTSEALSR
jgi:hypothetical protein